MGPNPVETEETMTLSGLLRKFAGSADCAALALPTGCSDDKPTETHDTEMLDTAAPACTEPATIIGVFQASLKAANSSTEVIGQVRNAPPPPNLVWTDVQEEGDCRLQEPSPDGMTCRSDLVCE